MQVSGESPAPGEGKAARPWLASLLAIVPALAAIVVIEAARVALTVSGDLTGRVLGTLAEVTTSGLRQLDLLVLVAVGQCLALLGTETRSRGFRLASRVLLAGLSALQIYLVWQVAIEAPYLARDFHVKLGFRLLAGAYILLALWISLPAWAPRVRRAAGAALGLAALIAAAAHYQVLVGLYPTLHSSAAMIAFLAVQLALAMVLVGLRPRPRLIAPLVAVPAAVLVVGALAPAPARSRGRPYVAAQSALVRPVVIAETPEHLMRPAAPPRRRDEGPVRPDLGAEARFAASSGLPRLPEGFDLAEHDVLILLIDALRYDRTSLADPELGTTPTIRELADGGAFSMTRATSPSNGTFPSMASLLSMTIPSFVRLEIHARHWHGKVLPEQRTAPEAFSRAGYRTFWVGHNFKRVMTIRVHGLWQGFDRRHLELIWPGRDLDADARIASQAIREIRAARAAGQRFFGVVFFISPHDDYQVHFPRRPSKTPRDRYDQEVLYADTQLKRVLDEVARGGGLERTVIVVTGDHGEAFGEHQHRHHLSSLYAEQVRVPLVIRVPGMEGEPRDRPTSNLYVLPWLMLRGPEPLRAPAAAALREDLGPVLRETGGAVVSEFISRQRQEATLRYADYTVYYDLMADFFRVFDARRDPLEGNDLREARPDLVERFTPKVQAYRRLRFAGQRYYFTDPPEADGPAGE